MSKLACIPFTLFVQYVAYKQSVPRLVQLTLVPITFGVGYATVYDLNLNAVGLGMSAVNLFLLLNFRMLTRFACMVHCSVRDVCGGGHCSGADFHEHLPEEFRL